MRTDILNDDTVAAVITEMMIQLLLSSQFILIKFYKLIYIQMEFPMYVYMCLDVYNLIFLDFCMKRVINI